jgi:hypothetical protein
MITLARGQGHALVVHHESGAPLVTIHCDGRVEINPAFTLDEATLAFWDAARELFGKGRFIAFGKLRELKDDWDSYGALAPTEDAICFAERVANVLHDVPGQAVPCVNGGVQLEWHADGIEIEFVVTPEGTFELE